MYVDGSDIGLTTNGEDIDAITVLSNGDLLISTTGNPSVPGLSGLSDEDLIRFTPTNLGTATSGTWAVYFDGSDVGLNNSGSEDTGGAWVDTNGDIYFTTRGAFAVNGVSGSGSDVSTCAGHTTGANTTCSAFSSFFAGSANGYGAELMDGLHITRS
jgi:hypothetical protein